MIELEHLTKKYGDFTAVDDLSLRIGTGEFFGLLGPNGAGKTTTISMLSTLVLPTSGRVLIDGEELTRQRPELKRKISGLGNVNVGAIEEFERVNERYEYLASQRDDVQQAKGELEDIIGDITTEMEKIFAEQFQRIG